ncbi:NADH-quinone oxidoreductase subunit B family protein [Anaeromyxobacter paludicola]|uniref:Oxidoreductase n=1 Tax=Anaeromyxobacter paludicola TaxID=2918171 RepID=A0ABM7XAC0_9BACT|nr:NADP oxidoreductase [Anaeromyxobacter paludicola]BDG08807.1 oxidoreductase [Anaeromyxobacter paludicola]
MSRKRFATVWLGGCSGCHMSFLDQDERLLELVAAADLVHSPVMDVKRYPEGVDVCLVEGAVANEEHLETLRAVRARTRILVAFGDCAVTGNVTALRNCLGGAREVLDRAYLELADVTPRIPCEPGLVPPLLDRVAPLHAHVPVDRFLPGCPPSADAIHAVLLELLELPAGTPPAAAPRFG